jgi:hypothetical protein
MNKSLRIGAITLGSLLLLFVLAEVTISWYASKQLRSELQRTQTDLTFEKLSISLINRSGTLRNVRGQYTLGVADTLSGSVSDLNLSGIRWLPLVNRGQLHARTLRIEDADITFWKGPKRMQSDRAETAISYTLPGKDTYRLELNQFQLRNARLTGLSTADSSLLYAVDTIQVTGEELLVVPRDTFSWSQLQTQAFGIHIPEKRKLHDIRIGELVADWSDNSLHTSNLSMTPRFSKDDFHRQLTKKTGRNELTISEVACEGFAFDRLLRDSVSVRRITIPDFEYRLFMDKRVPHDSTQYKKMPQEMLADAGFDIGVDSILIRDGYIKYEHLPAGESESGWVDFQRVQATVLHIRSGTQPDTPPTTVDVRSNLYGQGLVTVHWSFPSYTAPYTYSFHGSLGQFNMNRANSIVVPCSRMEILSGQIRELAFQATADNHLASGDMQFFFENADVVVTPKKDGFFNRLFTDIVEGIAIPKENLASEKHRIGRMYKTRDTSKSIFNHFWETLVTGMKSTIMPNLVLPEELDHEKDKGN